MVRSIPQTLTLVLALALSALGCDNADGPASKDGPGTKARRAGEPAVADGNGAAQAGGPELDQDILRDIDGIVENCTVNVERCFVRSCKNGEVEAFKGRFGPEGDKHALDALDTWTETLTSDNGETQTVGACVMSGVMSSHRRSALTVSPASAKRIVEALPKLAANQTTSAIMPMTHYAALGGELGGLFNAASDHERQDYLVPMVLGSAMTYGRLEVFPIIEAGGTSEAVAARAAALEAPRGMPFPTDAEKAKVCPWAETHLTDAEEKVFGEAADTMVWCGGEYIDSALDHGEARLANHQFSREMSWILKGLCLTPPGQPAHSDARCERSYRYLKKALKDELIDGNLRSDALEAIWEQGRDDRTLKLAKKYTADEAPEVQATATVIVERLRQ